MKTLRRCFAIASILVGGIAVAVPDAIVISGVTASKMLIAIATALNAVNLYLLKEEGYVEPTP